MKKLDGVLRRVRALEEKRGIAYAKPEGKLYKTLRVLYTLVYIYGMGINLLFIAAMSLKLDAGGVATKDVLNSIITVSVCSFLSIVGFILMYCKVYLTAGILSVVPLIFTIPLFAGAMEESIDGILGYRYSFYWRHFLPVLVLTLLMLWMTIIAKRAQIKTDRMYKKVTENLFNMYKLSEGEAENISEEQWESFLTNYNPDDYKGQFVKEITEEKVAEENE